MGFEERSDRKRGLRRSMRSVGDGYGHYPDCGDHGYIHQSKLCLIMCSLLFVIYSSIYVFPKRKEKLTYLNISHAAI